MSYVGSITKRERERDQRGGNGEKRESVVGQGRRDIYYYIYLGFHSPSAVKSSR